MPDQSQNTSPHISIILVSFKTGEPLFKTVRAALSQMAEVEVILVDNGNPEETLKRLKDLSASDPRLIIKTGHGNIGFGRANNLGVTSSRGPNILILNPDCILHADTLEKLLQYSVSLPLPFIIGARILNEDGSDQRGCRRELLTPQTAFVEALHLGRFFPKLKLNRHDEVIPSTLTPIPAISGAFMFMPRKAFTLVGGFDERYFFHVEDLDLCLRFRRAGGQIYFAPDVVATHIGGTSSVGSSFVEYHKAKGFIRYFHSNFGDKYPLIFLWCLDIAIWIRYLLRRHKSQTTH